MLQSVQVPVNLEAGAVKKFADDMEALKKKVRDPRVLKSHNGNSIGVTSQRPWLMALVISSLNPQGRFPSMPFRFTTWCAQHC